MNDAQNKAPSYPWYPGDFQRDEPVQLMSLEEEGAYRRLLDHQWLHGSIPADVGQLARICKNVSVAKMRKLWGAIEPCFIPSSHTADRLYNRKLERVRSEREAYRHQQSESGRRGAKKRWDKVKGQDGDPISDPMATPLPNSWPSSADADASASASSETTQSSSSRGRDNSTPIGYAQQCTGACNRGLRENPAYNGTEFHELVTSDQLEYAMPWFDTGIPVDFAAGVILARAREYKPSRRFRQPLRLSYFDQAVTEGWERSLAAESASGVAPIRPELTEPADDEFAAAARRVEARMAQ